VRTADQTRRAELDLDAGSTGADIIQAAVDNWALPADTDYTLVNTTTGKALAPGADCRRACAPAMYWKCSRCWSPAERG